MDYTRLSFKDMLGLSLDDLQRALLKLLLGLTEEAEETCGARQDVVPTPISVITSADFEKALAHWRRCGLPMLSSLPTRPCPACGAGDSHAVFESYDGYMFHECHGCGTWYVPLMVTWELFEVLFEVCREAEAVSRDVAARRRANLEGQEITRFERYFASVLMLLPESKGPLRYLDIGCSVGHSLQAGNGLGMLAHGVEVDPSAVEIASKGGHTVVRAVEDLPDGSYDIVSFWETLEHIADPLAELKLAASRMSEDGLLVLTVPNLMALGVRILREKCTYAYGGYNSPGHINFFSRDSIAMLLDRAGLSLIDVDYEFSSIGVEIAGYLHGDVDPSLPFSVLNPPVHVAKALNCIWPIITLLEAGAGTLPMMQCVACAKGREGRFADGLAEKARARASEVRNQALERLQSFPDLSDKIVWLETEITRRDMLLRDLEQHVALRTYNRLATLRAALSGLFWRQGGG